MKIKIKDKRTKPDTEGMIKEAIEAIPPVEFPIHPSPESHRDALEGLEGDDRLDVSAIKGIEELLKQLQGQISKLGGKVQTPRKVYTPRRDDFSGSTDGSTKAFTLSKQPVDTSTISVHSSDWPMILRNVVDFTVAGKTLTLTDEVDAPTAGSTLMVDYFT